MDWLEHAFSRALRIVADTVSATDGTGTEQDEAAASRAPASQPAAREGELSLGPDASKQVTSTDENGTFVLAEQGSWCYIGTGAQERAERQSAEDAFDEMFKKNASGH